MTAAPPAPEVIWLEPGTCYCPPTPENKARFEKWADWRLNFRRRYRSAKMRAEKTGPIIFYGFNTRKS